MSGRLVPFFVRHCVRYLEEREEVCSLDSVWRLLEVLGLFDSGRFGEVTYTLLRGQDAVLKA